MQATHRSPWVRFLDAGKERLKLAEHAAKRDTAHSSVLDHEVILVVPGKP